MTIKKSITTFLRGYALHFSKFIDLVTANCLFFLTGSFLKKKRLFVRSLVLNYEDLKTKRHEI